MHAFAICRGVTTELSTMDLPTPTPLDTEVRLKVARSWVGRRATNIAIVHASLDLVGVTHSRDRLNTGDVDGRKLLEGSTQ